MPTKNGLAIRGFTFALANLAIATSLGLILRFLYFGAIPGANFKYILHAHSHVGMLGWLFSGFYVFIWRYFVPESIGHSFYKKLFIAIQMAVLGMLLSFPFQGYGAISITFSTIHLILSYIFVFRVYKDTKGNRQFSTQLIRLALSFHCISTIGVWSLGPIMAQGGRDSDIYHLAIQFFLHFQFNGWFTFATLAMIFYSISKYSIPSGIKKAFLYLWISGTVLAFGQVIPEDLQTQFSTLCYGIGGLIRIVGFLLFTYILFRIPTYVFRTANDFVRILITIAFLVYGIMVGLFMATFILEWFTNFYINRFLSIGYIHLSLLGVFSLILVVFFSRYIHPLTFGNKVSWVIFTLGFILSEVLLFSFGLGIISGNAIFHKILFAASALMPLGAWIVLAQTQIIARRVR
ncbi:MAG: hypothetical protein JJU02_12165 [Cryomorphaceae bacterium]|nr:hypothetical protein [Cryomorphaceae bacterium]